MNLDLFFGKHKKLEFTKDIIYNRIQFKIYFYEDGFSFSILYKTKINYNNFNEVIRKTYIRNMIKKCLLITSLLNKKIYKEGDIYIIFGDLKFKGKMPKLYVLIDKISYTFCKKDIYNFAEYFLSSSISSFDGRVSCLISFLIGNSSEYQIDKFINYWTSLNCMYTKTATDSEENIRKECKKIEFFSKKYSLSFKNDIYNNLSNGKIKEIIDFINTETYKNQSYLLITKINKILSEEKFDKISNSDVDNFVMLYLGYYLRCSYVHGEKNKPLYIFECDQQLNCLIYINNILIKFIKKYMFKIWD